jgi:hypothetical protein
MSPKVLSEKDFVFYFHSYDVLHETRASIHVGKVRQDDSRDAKIWLEPEIEVGRVGWTLSGKELNDAIKIVKKRHKRLLDAWKTHKRKTD